MSVVYQYFGEEEKNIYEDQMRSGKLGSTGSGNPNESIHSAGDTC
jgi:hypothetical protein